MDESTGWCRGCYRTLDEIARWGKASLADQSDVLQQLPLRHQSAGFAQAQCNPAVDAASAPFSAVSQL
jgi:predicted Fe-S protein YdhL (DUF1289 family)